MTAKTSHVSVIIATFNSAQLLPKVLDSISRQTYPASKMEILVIDGGSTDETRTIAARHGCRIIDNPKTLPAWAKYIGYKVAKGKYALYLDSDEVFENVHSIEQKIEAIERNPFVHAVTGSGYKSPKRYFFLNQYSNEFGDPFSFFIYRLSKDYRFFIDTMKKKYHVVHEDSRHIVFDFSECPSLPIFELVTMGSLVDLHYLKKNFPEIMDNPGRIPHFFHLLVSKGAYVAIIKHDPLIHYSSDTLGKYLGKITSRVVNNIYTSAKEGFKGRDEFLKGRERYKKYLFIPYALSLVFPFIDALYLSSTRKNIGYLVHVPLCLYTACLILYYMSLKLVHIQPVFKSYGGIKSIST